MASYLLVYDLKDPGAALESLVLHRLVHAGWFTRVQKDGLSWRYPGGTLSGSFDDHAAAIAAYQAAIRAAQAVAAERGLGTVEIAKAYISQKLEVHFESDDKTALM